ncbi:MAG: type III restriction-modification system endonuclease [Ignavibacteriae bacterium]|nr:type III restriction-modification system endonuclease [Ignavibacteriota bacterium]
MKGFNFEKNLDHQTSAVNSTIGVFEGVSIVHPTELDKNYINPVLDHLDGNSYYANNITTIRLNNGIDQKTERYVNIVDIMMETGTGKTYTYTKTIFELNKRFGIFKFIVVVPTLSIKAGTIDFLKSESSREHFKEQYGKVLNLHIVESQKNTGKKSYIPPAVTSFVNSGDYEKNTIQVMIINAGMINSDTLHKSFDRALFDKYAVPSEAIGAVKPFMIIDEPHKFAQDNKTWKNIEKFDPQFILRYGATFPDKEIKVKDNFSNKFVKQKVKDYHNLVYQLTAVDSFNRNLVKGIIGHITEFENGKNAEAKFINSDGKEATFKLTENDKSTTIKVSKKESLSKVHSEMTDLTIEKLNKSTIVLSNGLEMKKDDKINPYSYAQTFQEIMIQKAIKHHFEIEKDLLTRDVRIKPITLFFIDNIDEYRNKDGYVRKTVEQYIKLEIEKLLESNVEGRYRDYLEKTLADISLTHGGYFSKDNTEKDEAIEKEINEILHDKQAMLDLENPRRFIFSKWTLREGWDNPNVFQICKLRSSGSDISKLQEVGRGLRLPVNEYGNRVKDEQFYLNYFVDFTESDFVDELVNEINSKSGAISIDEEPEKLHETLIKNIVELYKLDEDDLIDELVEKNVIRASHKFLEGGYDYIKQNYPLAFEGVNTNKIRTAEDNKKKVTVRTEKYQELRYLWEKLNEKVVLEYKFNDEVLFNKLFSDFLGLGKDIFRTNGINERIAKVDIDNNQAVVREADSIYGREVATISTMKYSDFLKELSKRMNINLKTLHQSLVDSQIDINQYLNLASIRLMQQNFEVYLMANAFEKFSIEYQRVTNTVHPTKLTDEKGNALKEVASTDIGVYYSNESVDESYFFNEMYFDSDIEKDNIKTKIEEVVVFTKIPKNSIKIPIAGGKSYSPDFAYVLKYEGGEKILHFVVESKNTPNEEGLRSEEKHKIRHAEKFFDGSVKIEFKKQFSNNKIVDLIKDIIEN